MKKFFLSIIACTSLIQAGAQDASRTILSPSTKSYLKHIELNKAQERPGYIYRTRHDGKRCISAIVKVNLTYETSLTEHLQLRNVAIGTKAKNIWTLMIPVEQVADVATLPGFEYFQLDAPIQPMLTEAKKATRVDSVHRGIGLPKGYAGKGILMGIIDFGFDYNHPSMYDTSGNRYRIVKSWEMDATGTPPAGFTYGNELADSLSLKAKGTDNEVQTHGTGVAGLAAGAGFNGTSSETYRGIAYESEMILVGVRRDSIENQWKTGGFSDFIDGVKYLTDYATSEGKPIVINISWGSHSGPHDGTSLVNQAFDAMAGPGKIIVMSAGNEGNNYLHLNKSFTATDTLLSTFLNFSVTDYKHTWIDVWGEKGKPFCVATTLYGNKTAGATTGKICLDNGVYIDTLIASNGLDTCFVETVTSEEEFNGKTRATINVYTKAKDSVCIQVYSNDGNVDLWNEYYYYGYKYQYLSSFSKLGFSWATDGNSNTTVSDMGAGFKTLLVGAYVSKNRYTDLEGLPRTTIGVVGRKAGFSSRGPYIDGRIKPDILAPGQMISTSVNSYDSKYLPTGSNKGLLVAEYDNPKDSRKYYYGEFNGTSASAPVASGIVALLLEIDPTLTPERIQKIIAETAIQDFYTGTIPPEGNNDLGHGKINAYQAVRALLKELSIDEVIESKEKMDAVLFPNPASNDVTLDVNSLYNSKAEISIIDISGKVIYSKITDLIIGNNQFTLPIFNLAQQVYFVKINAEQEGITLQLQIKK
jgi:minor extracellular serine protease Vpr